MKNTELLSPAGDFECFQSALKFGADAIYLAGDDMGSDTAMVMVLLYIVIEKFTISYVL